MDPGDVEADDLIRNPVTRVVCGSEGTLVRCKYNSSNVQIVVKKLYNCVMLGNKEVEVRHSRAFGKTRARDRAKWIGSDTSQGREGMQIELPDTEPNRPKCSALSEQNSEAGDVEKLHVQRYNKVFD